MTTIKKMKLWLTVLFALAMAHGYSQRVDCDVICAQKIDFNDQAATIRNIKNLRSCGLDSLDVQIFSNGPILGSLLVHLANNGNKVSTYGDLLKYIKQLKKSDSYQDLRKNYHNLSTQPAAKLPARPIPDYLKITDYGTALSLSKQQHKPVLLYFNDRFSINCQKLESVIFEDEQVKLYLQKFIIVNLDVVDKKALTKPIRLKNGKYITTVGERNSDLEGSLFNQNAQPFLGVINLKEQVQAISLGYVSKDDFLQFLIDAQTKWDLNK